MNTTALIEQEKQEGPITRGYLDAALGRVTLPTAVLCSLSDVPQPMDCLVDTMREAYGHFTAVKVSTCLNVLKSKGWPIIRERVEVDGKKQLTWRISRITLVIAKAKYDLAKRVGKNTIDLVFLHQVTKTIQETYT